MRILRKILILIIIAAVLGNILIGSGIEKNLNRINGEPVKAAVVLSSFDNRYISLVRENLERIQTENSENIEFTFFDGRGNQDIQNTLIDSVVKDGFNILLINLIDISTGNVNLVIDKIKSKNIPVIFFNIEPFIKDSIKSYGKAIVIATDAEQSGVLQGQILVNKWNNNKKDIDRNKDNILQYIMLAGARDNTLTIARTRYSIETINKGGIKTQEIEFKTSDGSKESSKTAIENALLFHGNKIEAIIANSDTIAIGAIEALQEYGYNKGDKSKTIAVVGANGIPEALELIEKGFMTGTVIQDAPAMAEAIYVTGMNLVSNRDAIEGTNYKFDDTGVILKLPYSKSVELP